MAEIKMEGADQTAMRKMENEINDLHTELEGNDKLIKELTEKVKNLEAANRQLAVAYNEMTIIKDSLITQIRFLSNEKK